LRVSSDTKSAPRERDKTSAHRLFTVVSEMMAEMDRAYLEDGAAIMNASLDRDLGFDSLSRMELVHRIEREFEVTLMDDVIARAETPGELLKAIGGKAGTTPTFTAEVFSTGQDGGAAPASADTLNRVLAWHADAHPERTHVRLLSDQGEAGEISYGTLWTDALELAAGLIEHDLQPGESVILMLPTEMDYFRAFFGVLLAGGVPVPVYPPGRPQQLEEHVRRHAAIADNARAGIMITVDEAKMFSRLLRSQAESLREMVTCDDLKGAEIPSLLPDPSPGDAAFIQYTSGSTGDPKGVVLSHANLLANIRTMGAHLEVTAEDVFVSWLPLYHDMGLIGAWLGSLTHAIPLVLMSPLSFLARPQRWLSAISNYKGTLSGAPNFAFEACLARIRDEDIEGCDLSSWRVAFCGAEPINVPTLEQFAARFANYGFTASAITPVYGLAENSVGLTFPPLGRGPRYDRIDRQTLSRTGRAEIAGEPGEQVLAVPSCGHPLRGHQLRIVDESGRELPDRREGRIQFHGPSSTLGYLRNAEATAALFDGDWLNSGDVGYTVDGEVYITGRTKDLIIRGGRNIYPAEIEAAVGELDGVRQGGVAVFGSPDPQSGTERLVIMAETRQRGDAAKAKLNSQINARASDVAGAPPDRVLLVPPRTVPKTSSGKVRRSTARQMFETGRVEVGTAAVNWQILKITASGLAPLGRRTARHLAHWLYAGYVGAAVLFVAPIAWLLVALLPRESWRWAAVRAALSALFSIARVKVTVDGLQDIPGKGPVILTSNHASYLDGALLVYALPDRFSFVAKAELRENFITRILLSRLGSYFVERFDVQKSIEDAKAIQRLAASGRRIVYFPEGTLSRMAGLLPFQTGAFAAAISASAVIQPVVIRGSRHVLRDGTYVPRPGGILVRIFPPMVTDPKSGTGRDDTWRRAIELRDRTRATILEHCGEPDLRHESALQSLADQRSDD